MPKTKQITQKTFLLEPDYSYSATPYGVDMFVGFATKPNPTSQEVGVFTENENDYTVFGTHGCTLACSFDVTNVLVNIWINQQPEKIGEQLGNLFDEGEVVASEKLFVIDGKEGATIETNLVTDTLNLSVYGEDENGDGFTAINLVLTSVAEETVQTGSGNEYLSSYSYQSPSSMEVLEQLTDMVNVVSGEGVIMPYGYPFSVEVVSLNLFPEGGLTESNLIKVLYEDEREIAPYEISMKNASTPYTEGAVELFSGFTEKFKWSSEGFKLVHPLEADKWREFKNYLYDHFANLTYIASDFVEVKPNSYFVYFEGNFNPSGKGEISVYDGSSAPLDNPGTGKTLFSSDAFLVRNCLEEIPIKVVQGEVNPKKEKLIDRGRIKIGRKGLILSGDDSRYIKLPEGKADIHIYGIERKGKIVKLLIAINRLVPAKSMEEWEGSELIIAGQLMNINIKEGKAVKLPSLGDWFFLRSRAD